MEAGAGREGQGGSDENQAGPRSRQEATQGFAGHAEKSGIYCEDNGEPLEAKQPATKSQFFRLFGKTWKKPAYPEVTSLVNQ